MGVLVFHRSGEIVEQLGPPAAKYDWFTVVWPGRTVHGIIFGQTVCSAEILPLIPQSYEMELYVNGVRIANTGVRDSVNPSGSEAFVDLHCFGYVKLRKDDVILMKVEVVTREATMYAHKTDLAVIF
jgi:hypothetical protein